MNRKRNYFSSVIVFLFAQSAWLALVGLWIYWYVSNYVIFTEVNDRLYPQIVFGSRQIAALIGGLVLLMTVSTGLWLIFAKLRHEIDVTTRYDNFIAHVTHELKSPLASIQLYLETMIARKVPHAKQQEFFELMMQDASRLDGRINSILEIARLEERRTPYRFTSRPMRPLVDRLVQEAASQFKLASGSIHVRGDIVDRSLVDYDAMKVVFNNLIDNAVKYSVGPAQIDVSVARVRDRVVLEFADDGIGIPVPDQKAVFRKFWRHSGSETPTVTGTGLGLYWVKEIVRHHGGRVSAHSKGKNLGSTFRIELPLAKTSAVESDSIDRNTALGSEITEKS